MQNGRARGRARREGRHSSVRRLGAAGSKAQEEGRAQGARGEAGQEEKEGRGRRGGKGGSQPLTWPMTWPVRSHSVTPGHAGAYRSALPVADVTCGVCQPLAHTMACLVSHWECTPAGSGMSWRDRACMYGPCHGPCQRLAVSLPSSLPQSVRPSLPPSLPLHTHASSLHLDLRLTSHNNPKSHSCSSTPRSRYQNFENKKRKPLCAEKKQSS